MLKKRSWGRLVAQMTVVVAAAALYPTIATAEPVTATGAFHLLDNRADNSIGTVTGVRQQFGANAVPNGGAGTTATAAQGALSRALTWFNFDTTPNFFSDSRPANTAPDGAWVLTFNNGANTTVVNTPTIAGAAILPFVNSMAVTPGPTPTFNWTVPSGVNPDAVRVQIRDTTGAFVGTGGSGGVGGEGVANIIYQRGFAGTTTSFTVNPADAGFTQALQPGRTYSFELQLLDLRNAAGNTTNANTLSRSRTFFDFSLLSASAPGQVFLPTLVPGATPFYSFNVQGVVGGQTIFIDPLVAIGYDYQIGAGDPNFRSVTLPTGIGDDMYDLWLWSGSNWVDAADLFGGQEYGFGPGGVDRFRILGIETSAGLDPNDVTAFITGISFVGNGQFTGTMTPISVNIAAVPEPGSFALLGLGLLAIRLARRSNGKA